jgi:DNA adenine methylase
VRYVGGKARIAKWIRDHVLAIADEYRGVPLTYVEPFVGSGAVLEQVVKTRRFARHIANDIHPDLIRMWHALSREGWMPPVYIEADEYKEIKNSEVPSAIRGYAGFACSFGGKFFGGHEYRRDAKSAQIDGKRDGSPGGGGQDTERRSVLRIGKAMRRHGVELQNTDYEALVVPPGSVVYNDPPYVGTQGYDSGHFDHERFWRTADRWVANGSIVFVSEYEGPWPVIDEHPRNAILAHSFGDRRTERLFMRRP